MGGIDRTGKTARITSKRDSSYFKADGQKEYRVRIGFCALVFPTNKGSADQKKTVILVRDSGPGFTYIHGVNHGMHTWCGIPCKISCIRNQYNITKPISCTPHCIPDAHRMRTAYTYLYIAPHISRDTHTARHNLNTPCNSYHAV